MRRLIPLLIALAAFAIPSAAHATQKKAIWGPTEFQGDSQFPVYKQLHAAGVQLGAEFAEQAEYREVPPPVLAFAGFYLMATGCVMGGASLDQFVKLMMADSTIQRTTGE